MVCPRCLDTVREIFDSLSIDATLIELGEVTTSAKVSTAQTSELKDKLAQRGFELLEDHNSKLISQIKGIIVAHVHHSQEALKVNYSTLLAESLHHDYSSLSRLFSSVEGITIERFILKQKIEKVKELIFYNEFSLSEIAHRMKYSSVAHLSAQFKKETGITPTVFKNQHRPGHNPLDSI
jgi:AraC-like DNA-binding protein